MFAVVLLCVIVLLLVLMNTNAFSDQKPQRKTSANGRVRESVRSAPTNTNIPHQRPATSNTPHQHPASPQESKFVTNENRAPMMDGGRVGFNVDIASTLHREIDKAIYTTSKTIHSNEGFQSGEYAEFDVIRRLRSCGIPPETIFHNLYVAKMGGVYTQVDIVVPIDVGILVFEVKDYKGWIYGNVDSKYWTQVLDYGKIKHKFYNPIIQNISHISALRNQQEQLYRVPFFSIIVLHGSAEFKGEVDLQDNTFLIHPHEIPKVLKYIRATHNPAPYTNKWGVMEVFQMSVDNGKNPQIVAKHNLRMSQYKH